MVVCDHKSNTYLYIYLLENRKRTWETICTIENVCHSFVCPVSEAIVWKVPHRAGLLQSSEDVARSFGAGRRVSGQVLKSGPRDAAGGRVRNSSGWGEQPGLSPAPRATGRAVGPALAAAREGGRVLPSPARGRDLGCGPGCGELPLCPCFPGHSPDASSLPWAPQLSKFFSYLNQAERGFVVFNLESGQICL